MTAVAMEPKLPMYMSINWGSNFSFLFDCSLHCFNNNPLKRNRDTFRRQCLEVYHPKYNLLYICHFIYDAAKS